MCKHGEIEWVSELGPHGRYIDKCMVDTIRELRSKGVRGSIETLACCCGHGIYPQTIVIICPERGVPIELYRGIYLKKRDGRPRTRRFYVTDENGLYFIPEVVDLNRR